MVHLCGLEVREATNRGGASLLRIIGLRPGERPYEELRIGDNVEGAVRPLIMRGRNHEVPWDVLTDRSSQRDVEFWAVDFEPVLSVLGLRVRECLPVPHREGRLLWREMVEPQSGDATVH